MTVMILESNLLDQKKISNMFDGSVNLEYQTSVLKAINFLGLEKVDMAFVDADYNNGNYDWKELTSFLKDLNINYSIFSSNGKVGTKNGQTIISINDLPTQLSKEN